MEEIPDLLLKDHLTLPLNDTKRRMTEINEKVDNKSKIIVNSLFIMSVLYLESMVR